MLTKIPDIYVLPPNELGEYKDPDELVRAEGLDTFRKTLKSRISGYRYKARSLVEEHRSGQEWKDHQLDQLIAKAIDFASTIDDLTDLNLYFWPEIFQATGLSEEDIEERRERAREEKEEEVRSKQIREALRDVGGVLREDGPEEAIKILKDKTAQVSALISNSSSDPKPLVKELDHHRDRIAKFKNCKFIGLPQKTLPTLDQFTRGLRGLQLLAGPPGAGKTALGVQIGVDIVANNENASFIFLSLEMLRWDIITRVRCRETRKNWGEMMCRGGDFDQAFESGAQEQNTSGEVLGEIGDRILILDENNFPEPTVSKVLNITESFKEQTETDRVFLLLDYLQVFPIPDQEKQKLRSDLDRDKWRIGAMKQLRDGLDDSAVMVISEARKPSGNSTESWGGAMADVMGAARGTYTPDMVALYRPFLKNEYNDRFAEQGEEDLDGEEIRDKFFAEGLAPSKIIIAKGRDGFQRGQIDLLFHFRQSWFEEITDDYRMPGAEAWMGPPADEEGETLSELQKEKEAEISRGDADHDHSRKEETG